MKLLDWLMAAILGITLLLGYAVNVHGDERKEWFSSGQILPTKALCSSAQTWDSIFSTPKRFQAAYVQHLIETEECYLFLQPMPIKIKSFVQNYAYDDAMIQVYLMDLSGGDWFAFVYEPATKL